MMSFVSFLKLVEIQTKVASVIPFLSGTFYALYRFNAFSLKNFLLMFGSLMCIDMTVTTINNYQDFRKANKRHGYGYESHNAIVRDSLKESWVLSIIAVLFSVAAVLGFLLFVSTNIVVLALGSASFVIGILYSFGPVPISRTPFGEIFSGVFMGFIIPFIAIYIHAFDGELLNIMLQGKTMSFEMNVQEMLYIVLISVPSVTGIANIMLANNICDIEDDTENKRYTLPIFIGRDNSLKLFTILYCIGYSALAALVVLGAVSLILMLVLVTIIPVGKNIRIFYEKQIKEDTFVLSVKNFIIVNGALAFILAVQAIINFIL
ncbi:1,4-dihydroxy-2-naphthoate polyprenyltransferase [Anaerobacterium chartisolvens]|nr:1,4-dihydroxy-2-naphthoate polyprenyltransferase [Anaerobacterium chartisolvens]